MRIKRKKQFWTILFVMLLSLCLVSCGIESKIEGTWYAIEDGETLGTLIFDDDGKCYSSEQSDAAHWSVEDDKLILSYDGDAEIYDVSVNGDTMTISRDGETLHLSKNPGE